MMPKMPQRTIEKKGGLDSVGYRKTRVSITPDADPVDGYEIPVEASSEKWSEYELKDGTVVRMKQILIEIIRIDGMYDADGKPMYITRAAPIVNIISVPSGLMKKV